VLKLITMLTRRVVAKFRTLQTCVCRCQCTSRRKYSEKKVAPDPGIASKSNLALGNIGSKYQVFRDEDAEIIMDVNEERLKYASGLQQSEELTAEDSFHGLNLQRGKTGVFEIEDLVSVLKRENAESLFVATVPPEFKYVDYICIVSGKSHRHMLAIAQFVRRVFKQKMHKDDIIPKLEGASSNEWMALDLGNIALHVFSREARGVYDVDSLWSVGPQFDNECIKEDPVVEMLQKHSIYLRDLQPAE